MPRTQYPITGVVVDVDGSTKMSSGTVTLIDVTLGERISERIESDGSFSLDVANLTTQYSDGDKLQVVIYDSDKVKSTEFRHTLDTNLTGYDAGTLCMHWTSPVLEDCTLTGIVISNKNDSNEYTVDLYDRESDSKILTFDVGTDTSFSPNLLFKGVKFEGGICVIREVDTANTVEVQMIVK